MRENLQFIGVRNNEFKDLLLKHQPAARPIDDCFTWVVGAGRLFGERFFMWLQMALIMTLISSMIFVLAQYFLPDWQINQIWQPFAGCCFVGGLITSVASWAEEDDLKLRYLFSGFQYKFIDLFVLYLMTGVLVSIPLLTWYVISPEMLIMTRAHLWATPALLLTLCFTVLAALIILWFAPALIVLHDLKPWAAMKKSIQASLNNVLTLFVFSVIASVILYVIYHSGPQWLPALVESVGREATIALLVFVSSLTIVFGALILYVSYRNVWTNLEVY